MASFDSGYQAIWLLVLLLPIAWVISRYLPNQSHSQSVTNLRIRHIPKSVSKEELHTCLSALTRSTGPEDVRIFSLEPSPTHPSTKVAIARLRKLPPALVPLVAKTFHGSVFLKVPSISTDQLALDSSFLGFTPFACPANIDVDIIAVIGLGGHALKSWTKRGHEQIWLRDYLPQDIPHARILSYGYNTLIARSDSKATITDLAKAFLESLKNCRNATEEQQRPIIFIAHSLGGLVVKEALAQASTTGRNENQENLKIFNSSYGLVFFGVPNKGLSNASLVSIVQGNPNANLIDDLQVDSGHEPSTFLRSLHNRFDTSFHSSSKVIAFYENRHTRTLKEDPQGSGQFKPGEHTQLIVTEDSATSISSTQKLSNFLAMDRDHVNLVKFEDSQEEDYLTVKRYLVMLATEAPLTISSRFSAAQSFPPLYEDLPRASPLSSLIDANDSRVGSCRSGINEMQSWDSASDLSKYAQIPAASEKELTVHDYPDFRNFAFIGRDDILLEMHSFLTSQPALRSSGPNCCVLHGLGGQGKSQTALEYTYRYREFYNVIFWLEAEEDQELARSYALIASKLEPLRNESSESGQDPTKGVQDARKWFESTTDKRWLLIFDNLENTKDLLTYLPKKARTIGSIIVTTQKAHMMKVTEMFHKIPLQALNPDIGAELLFKSIGKGPKDEEENTVAKDISRWVGGLPLALATVGGYIKQSESTPQEVFRSLCRSSKVWASTGQGAIANYNKTLATVFDLALSELNPNARHLIDVIAFLNPDHIPQEMLVRRHDDPALQFLCDQDEFLEITHDLGLRQLIKRSKAATTDAFLSIHRSLQRNVLHALHGDKDNNKRQRIFEEAFSIIRNVLPRASARLDSEPEVWPVFFKYVPQVISMRSHSVWPDPPLLLGFHAARMLCDIGTFLWHTGQFNDCDAALSTAEQIVLSQTEDVQASPESKALLSDVYNFTGIICDIVGVSKRADSIRIRLACLKLRQDTHQTIPPADVTVDDEIRLETAWNDVGCSYMQLGRYHEAGLIFDKMLEFFKKWGPEHKFLFEYAKYYHHCAFVRMAQGKPDIAVAFAEKGVELQKRHEKEVNTMVLIHMYDSASLLYNAGEVSRSLEMHEEVLRLRLQICGESSQFTLESWESTGALHFLTGNLIKAEKYLLECLDWQRRANWTEEGIARARFRLSQILRAKGDISRADEELKAAREVRDRFLIEYPQYLTVDPADEVAVFDQMLPMWVTQFTGPLQEGGRRRDPKESMNK